METNACEPDKELTAECRGISLFCIVHSDRVGGNQLSFCVILNDNTQNARGGDGLSCRQSNNSLESGDIGELSVCVGWSQLFWGLRHVETHNDPMLLGQT